MKRKLTRKGFASAVIEKTILRLTSIGYLNDEEYGRSLFARYRDIQNSGRKKIQFEMRKRGIPSNIIHRCLEEISDNEEYEKAAAFVDLMKHKLADMPAQKKQRKIQQTLIRRGFSFDCVREAMQQFYDDENR